MAKGKDENDKGIPIRHFTALIEEDDDCETADVFIQAAVFGEIVYG